MNQKKTPLSRLTLRVGDKIGACRNSLRSDKSTRFGPILSPMPGAAQRGYYPLMFLSVI